MALLYRLPLRRFLLVDTVEKFPRLNEPRGSCRRDVSIMWSSQIYERKTRERAKESHAQSYHATKNTPVLEYVSFDDTSTGYFALSWKSNVSLCVLGQRARILCRCFIVRQRDWYIAKTILPRGNVISETTEVPQYLVILFPKKHARLFLTSREKCDKNSGSTMREGRYNVIH